MIAGNNMCPLLALQETNAWYYDPRVKLSGLFDIALIAIFASFAASVALVPSCVYASAVSRASLGLTNLFVPGVVSGDGHEYGENSLLVSGAVRAWQGAPPDNWTRISSLSFALKGGRDSIRAMSLDAPVNVLRAAVLGSTLTRRGELYFVRIGTGFNEDARIGGSPDWLFSASIVGTHRIFGDTRLLFGVARSDLFGEVVFMPVLGLRHKLSDMWRVSFAAPFVAQLNAAIDPYTELRIFARAAGSRARVAVGLDALNLNSQRARVGAGLDWQVTETSTLMSETGFEFARRSWLTDSENRKIREERIGAGSFFILQYRYRFGTTDGADAHESADYVEYDQLVPSE